MPPGDKSLWYRNHGGCRKYALCNKNVLFCPKIPLQNNNILQNDDPMQKETYNYAKLNGSSIDE
jgi:hypothetical protein